MNDKIINSPSFLILIQIKNNGRSFYFIFIFILSVAEVIQIWNSAFSDNKGLKPLVLTIWISMQLKKHARGNCPLLSV